MLAHIDRRLREKINAAGVDGLVDAILIVKEGGGSSFDDGGLARRVIKTAIERTGDRPVAVRYLPRANAAVISASSRLLREILKDENLVVASPTDIDLMDLLFN